MSDHPEYGTCPHCIRGIRVHKNGTLKPHSTPELALGNIKATFNCPGSHQPYAEANGYAWNLRLGQFQRLPLKVDMWEHDFGADESTAPTNGPVEVPYSEEAEWGLAELVRSGCTFHAYFREGDRSFDLVLKNAEGETLQTDPDVSVFGAIGPLLASKLKSFTGDTLSLTSSAPAEES